MKALLVLSGKSPSTLGLNEKVGALSASLVLKLQGRLPLLGETDDTVQRYIQVARSSHNKRSCS